MGGAVKPLIHATAVVDDGAMIGVGTQIWHFSHVMPGARIGEQCRLGQNVFVGRDVQIGNRVKIQNNVSVYENVTLEDEVFCGPSAVFTNVREPRSAFPKDPATGFLPTRVERGATIGANATVVCGVTIGAQAFIGAGSVVTKDVPPHALAYGNPARVRGWMCACGQRLPLSATQASGQIACSACGRAYELSDTRLRETQAAARAAA